MTTRIKMSLFVLVAGFGASSAIGQQMDLSWHTVDSGGVSATGGSGFEMAATIAQSDSGLMAGQGWELSGGFWLVPQTCDVPADLNGDGVADALDIQGFVDCLMGLGDQCVCAQMDEDPLLGEADVEIFVSLLIGGAGLSAR